MKEKTVQVMITMPESYRERLTAKARGNGRTVSGLVRYWLDRDDRMEMKKLSKKAGII